MEIEKMLIEEENSHDRNWNIKLKELYDMVQETGSAVPNPATHKAISNWLSGQRRQFKNKKLSKDRAKALKKLGVSLEKGVRNWDEQYALLEAYKEENGHVDVPYRNVNQTSSSLGQWVRFQRHYFKEKTLSQDKIDKLEALGFSWVVSDETRYVRGDRRGYAE